METRLMKLKSDFNNIITIRTNVKNVFDILEIRIDKLRQIYAEFINNNPEIADFLYTKIKELH